MGLNTADGTEVVGAVAEQLERDNPYEAMAAGMKHLDLCGTYRLFAVLLISPQRLAGVELDSADIERIYAQCRSCDEAARMIQSIIYQREDAEVIEP